MDCIDLMVWRKLSLSLTIDAGICSISASACRSGSAFGFMTGIPVVRG
jgi:hypothetical protein